MGKVQSSRGKNTKSQKENKTEVVERDSSELMEKKDASKQ